MPAFCLLTDAKQYRPCPNDMLRDVAFRDHWLAHFREHFAKTVVPLALEQYGEGRRADVQECLEDMLGELAALQENPRRWGELNLLVLDVIRQQKLLSWGLPDPFENLKVRENEAMLPLYPRIVAELDAHGGESGQGLEELLLLLAEGVFAGNIFDMGTNATAGRFAQSSVDFLEIRDSLGGQRPWLVDDLEKFTQRIVHGPAYRKAVIFVDNAGSDIVLGVMPLARFLAKRGAEVVLAANDLPALNDVTFHELKKLLPRISELDPLMADLIAGGRMRTVNSGGIAPLIDLRHVSAELNAEAADADLVILEGMGRSLESNFDTQFTVDAVKVCMVKDPMVAQRHGGKLFDTVWRFDRGTKKTKGSHNI